jgi:hypothetical protein
MSVEHWDQLSSTLKWFVPHHWDNCEGLPCDLHIPNVESIHQCLPYLKMSHEKSNYFIYHLKFSQ